MIFLKKIFVTLGRRSAETLGTRERFGAIGVRRKRVNPLPPGEGEISLPHNRAIFSKLKNEDKDLFSFRNCKKWFKKSTKCNYFHFFSILRKLAATWKLALHREKSDSRGGKMRVRKPSGCLWMNTAQYRFAIRWSLIFSDSDTIAAFLLKWSAGNGNVFINPIRQ